MMLVMLAVAWPLTGVYVTIMMPGMRETLARVDHHRTEGFLLPE